MTYVRFVMAFEGKVQGIGFMAGLHHTGMKDEGIDELLLPFNLYLDFPPYKSLDFQESDMPKSYFTKAGCLFFENDIQRIVDAVKKLDNGWEVIKTYQNAFPEENVCYEDEHQVLVNMARPMKLAEACM